MTEKSNNCISLNIFTTKIKNLKKQFEQLLSRDEIDNAIETKKKLEIVLAKANKFASDSLGEMFERKGKFVYVGDFVDGVAIASRDKDDVEYMIDTKGEIILKAEDIVPSGNGGYAIRIKNGGAFFTDSRGMRISEEYSDIRKVFKEGFAIIRNNDKFFFIDSTYQKVLDLEGYIHASPFCEGVAWVKSTKGRNSAHETLINQTGKKVLDEKFYQSSNYSEGLLGVERRVLLNNFSHGEWHYINLEGKSVIKIDIGIPDATIRMAHPFHEGIARVDYSVGNKLYKTYIDKEGQRISYEQFEQAEDPRHGLGRVKIDGKFYFIDKKGKRAFGGRSFLQNQRINEDGFIIMFNEGDKRWMDIEGNLYTIKEMKKKKDILETAEDIKEFFEKIGV